MWPLSSTFFTSSSVDEVLILLYKIIPDRHILGLDDMYHDAAVLDQFKVFWWSLLDGRLELSSRSVEALEERQEN